MSSEMIALFTQTFSDSEGEAEGKTIGLLVGDLLTTTPEQELAELGRIQQGVKWGLDNQLVVNAGHGLHYHNVEPVAAIKGINELNIGHGLMARAMFVGMKQAVQEMLALMLRAS